MPPKRASSTKSTAAKSTPSKPARPATTATAAASAGKGKATAAKARAKPKPKPVTKRLDPSHEANWYPYQGSRERQAYQHRGALGVEDADVVAHSVLLSIPELFFKPC